MEVYPHYAVGDRMIYNVDHGMFQKLEEKARKAEEALAAEEKVRKELEVLNSKLLAEKTALLDSLAGEKGSLAEYQEKSAKLQAQKNDLDNQLRVSIHSFIYSYFGWCLQSVRCKQNWNYRLEVLGSTAVLFLKKKNDWFVYTWIFHSTSTFWRTTQQIRADQCWDRSELKISFKLIFSPIFIFLWNE